MFMVFLFVPWFCDGLVPIRDEYGFATESRAVAWAEAAKAVHPEITYTVDEDRVVMI